MTPINKKLATMTEMYTLSLDDWVDLNDSIELFSWLERYQNKDVDSGIGDLKNLKFK